MALLLGASLAPMVVLAFTDGALPAILLWLLAVAVSWGAVHVFVARPLLSLDAMAKAFARGDTATFVHTPGDTAPAEIASLQNSLIAMAEAIRGREDAVDVASTEQRALLREVNHRVMNNLQVVMSVLSIQARSTSNADEKLALARVQRRVQLLALTQSQIYASGEVHDVRLDQLLAEIARTMIDTRGAHEAAVTLTLALEAVRMATDRAASTAFLIAEIISLTLSRIPGDTAASIALSLHSIGEFEIEFSIASPGAVGASGSSDADIRLISDMAREVGASILRDPAHPMTTHMRLRTAPIGRVAR